MPFQIVIAYDLPDFAFVKRDLDRIHRIAGKKALEWFIRERLQHRFDGSLRVQLRYEPRDEWYKVVKRKTGKPVVDHRWRGRSKAAAARATTRVTAKKLTIRIDGLSGGYGRFKSPTKPNLLAEIRRFLPDEVDRIAKLYVDEYRRQVVDLMNKGARKRGRVASAEP
jgi:hypothetical protein